MLLGKMLIVESQTTGLPFLSERVDSFHIGLQQVVFVLDAVFDKVLELFHLDLHDDFVDVWVAVSSIELGPINILLCKACHGRSLPDTVKLALLESIRLHGITESRTLCIEATSS